MTGKKYTFNYKFYTELYNDLKNLTKNQALDHYLKHGISEKRISCKEEFNDIINKNLLKIKKQKKTLNNMKFQKPENKLNILIRTSMRPEFFKKCIESILSQKYTNFNVYICYDKEDSLSYLNDYESKYTNITTFFIQNDSVEKYKFNLYNNTLMDKVSDGFIIFLDDDDIFSHDMCFKIINETIHDENDILVWKFMRPDKLVYPKDINDIKLGEIDTTSICFHNKYKQLSRWDDKQCGDYYFYSKLFNELKSLNKFNIIKLNYIITKTSFLDKLGNSI